MSRRTLGARWVTPVLLGGLVGCAPDHPATSLSHDDHGATAPSRRSRERHPPESPNGAAEPGRASPAVPPPPPDETGLEARYGARRALRVLTGEASYYGDSLAGHRTANGERYDPNGFTAANRTLPFGTVVRVVRTDSNARGHGAASYVVYVRITDRGPFGRGRRILDLSRAAAERLHMVRAGVAQVRAEIVEYGPRPRRRR